MSDIDDDLLALAGGAVSSDEEDDARSLNRSRDDSQSPPPSSRKDAPAKGVAARKAGAKKTMARRRSDESEEEGEASSAASSPRSEASVPMDESDSDSDRPSRPHNAADEEEDKFPVDGLFASLAEKASIMSMREVERETILAERVQEKEKMQQNRLLRQLVEKNEQQKKRTASSAGLGDNDSERRKTSRVRTKIGGTRVGETNSALDSLKRARAEKSERTRRREEDKERRKARSPSYRDDFDDDGDADSEIEWAAPGTKPKSKDAEEPKREDPPAELEEIQRIRLGRSRFGQVCFHPGFEDKMVGCFVRCSIGPDPENGENLYRMAVIKGISKGKEYATDGAHGSIITDQYVTAAHGKATREWPFIALSNSPFTDAEWRRYKSTCANEGLTLPLRSVTENKIKDINSLINHRWTEQEVSQKIERIQKLKSKFQGYDRLQLEREIDEYRALGMNDKADELQEKVDKFETPRLAFRTSLTPSKKTPSSSFMASSVTGSGSGSGSGSSAINGGMSQQDRLAQVNAENRRRNRDMVRRAQLKERAHVERGRLERSESRMSLNSSSQQSNGGGGNGNGTAPGSGASTPANGSSTPKGAAKATVLPHVLKLQQQQSTKDKLPTIHKPLMDDDIIGALDLDIDEDILV